MKKEIFSILESLRGSSLIFLCVTCYLFMCLEFIWTIIPFSLSTREVLLETCFPKLLTWIIFVFSLDLWCPSFVLLEWNSSTSPEVNACCNKILHVIHMFQYHFVYPSLFLFPSNEPFIIWFASLQLNLQALEGYYSIMGTLPFFIMMDFVNVVLYHSVVHVFIYCCHWVLLCVFTHIFGSYISIKNFTYYIVMPTLSMLPWGMLICCCWHIELILGIYNTMNNIHD